jgi:hypothetical protein
MNRQLIRGMRGPLRDLGGRIYEAPGVEVVCAEARGYLALTGEPFDVIALPAVDAFGASGAGVYATQESYLYTVEAIEAMLARLSPHGVLVMTRWARTPPREGPRLFATAAEALRRRGLDPADHLAMIRSWITVSVLVSPRPLTGGRAEAVRAFCAARSFDLCWLPGMTPGEANRFHLLEEPWFYEAASALLGPGRERFEHRYLFRLDPPTDERPYFFNFFRWEALPVLSQSLKAGSAAFVELGYLLLVAAAGQTILAGLVLIVLPLAPGVAAIRREPGKMRTLGYFILLGLGFMLLEMGLLQRLILYLAHPVYSAAVVIGSFLVFGGLGSLASARWVAEARRRAAMVAGGCVVALGMVYVWGLGPWLGWTQSAPVWTRFLVACGTIAPLAFAMGHLFPLGLARTRERGAALVPWAWAVNGSASVSAAALAPLVAMRIGFSGLALVATGCYAAAALVWLGWREKTR